MIRIVVWISLKWLPHKQTRQGACWQKSSWLLDNTKRMWKKSSVFFIVVWKHESMFSTVGFFMCQILGIITSQINTKRF